MSGGFIPAAFRSSPQNVATLSGLKTRAHVRLKELYEELALMMPGGPRFHIRTVVVFDDAQRSTFQVDMGDAVSPKPQGRTFIGSQGQVVIGGQALAGIASTFSSTADMDEWVRRQQQDLETAHGAGLDEVWGAFFGLSRMPGENDVDYRERLRVKDIAGPKDETQRQRKDEAEW